MEIRVSNGLLHLGDTSVRYAQRNISPDEVIQVLAGWRTRLTRLFELGRTVYLPFSIDEETIEAFEADLQGSQVRLCVVNLDAFGYVPGVDSLVEEIHRDRPVLDRRARELLVCDADVLISALDVLCSQRNRR